MRTTWSRSRRGQSMVEFALVAPVLIMFIFGIVDFGRYFSSSEAVLQAARAGARYAIVHPTAWSNADPAPSASIEGTIQAAAGSIQITNNDTYIGISYYDVSSGSAVKCGHYSAATNSFVSDNGSLQAACIYPGHIVQVSVSYVFQLDAPPFDGMNVSTTITQTTQLLEEQP